MIKISNTVTQESLVDNNFNLVKNTCYINNFTLRIFSNPGKSNTTKDDAPPIADLNYDLRSRSNKNTHTSAKIINLDGRISLDKPISPEEGNMDLQWTDENNNLILIKLRFELTDKKNQAYQFKLFFKEINEIFQKYRDLNEPSKKQGKLDYFLRPHIIGIRNFISQLNTPLEISYKIEGDKIKLFGYDEGELHNYIRNQQIEFEGIISVNISVNNKRMTMYWSDEEMNWHLDSKFIGKIPSKGFMVINPKTDLKKTHDDIRSHYSRDCLERMNIDPNSEGSKILRKIFSQHKLDLNDIDISPLVKNSNIYKFLGRRYERLSFDQKKIIEDFLKNCLFY